mgnify:FL=1
MKNNVICYFSNIENYSFSDESFALIESWKENWSEKGWNPIVLNEDYARSNKILERINLKDFGSNLYKFSANKPHYLIQCYYKWLAYTQFILENGATLWCDYDVYNRSLPFTEFEKKYGQPARHCGSGAVGILNEELSKKWLNYLEAFYDYNIQDKSNKEFQKLLTNQEISDMTIFQSFANAEDGISWCPLSFNFDRHPNDVDIHFIRKHWSLYHIHGGLAVHNHNKDYQSLNIPENCTTRLSVMTYIKSLLNDT